MNAPHGDLCVLPSDDHKTWTVSICHGTAPREELQRFETRLEAMEFAFDERKRRRSMDGKTLDLHVPDDCPCYWSGQQ